MEKSTADKKSALRKQFRTIRSSIATPDRECFDKAIADRVLSLPQVHQAKVVFVYLSRSGEAGTASLVQDFLRQHKRVITPSPDISALPHDGLFRVTPRPDQDGHFPPVLCRESRIDEVDVILVPGVVWDRTGYRIGFGGGYFDRLLSMARPGCLSIGMAYECQLVDAVPRDPWDEQADLVVTERDIYRM